MSEHNILTINQMFIKILALFMFKQNEGLNQESFNKISLTNNSQHNTIEATHK